MYFTPHLGEENTFEDAFPQLMEAITADREYITEHTRLLLRAQEWLNADRNHSLLLHGKEVNEAEAWLTSASDKDPKPLALHSEYIFASRARQRSLQRRLLFGVSIAMALSLALAAVAIVASFNATRSNATATSLLLSIRVENALAENDIRTALSLAMEANNLRFIRDDAPNFSKQTLASIAYDPGVRRVINVSDTSIWAIERQPNAGTLIASGTRTARSPCGTSTARTNRYGSSLALFNGSIWDVTFHPDGSQVAAPEPAKQFTSSMPPPAPNSTSSRCPARRASGASATTLAGNTSRPAEPAATSTCSQQKPATCSKPYQPRTTKSGPSPLAPRG